MRRAFVLSLVVHACALALLPWSSLGRAAPAAVQFASAVIEQPASIEPDVAEPVHAEDDTLPGESYELPAPAVEIATEFEALPSLPRLPRRPSMPGPYRLPRPLQLRRLPAPVSPPTPATKSETVEAVESSVPPRIAKGSQVPPRYPPLARRRAWQGTVVLEIAISATGVVETVAVRTTSGYAILDREAMRVARQWRYEPGTRSGCATAATLLQPVEFRLR